MELHLIEERLRQFQNHYLSYLSQKLVDRYIVPENIQRRRCHIYSFDQWLYSKNIIKLVDFENKNIIPIMTDPLGKYWDQCDTTKILCDDKFAKIKIEDFLKLHEYSRSTPSGVYTGKCWRMLTREGIWYIAWYGVDPDPNYRSNNYRQAQIIL
jgi:hypothetical protein